MVSAPTLTSNFLHYLETSERLNHPNKVQARDFFSGLFCFLSCLLLYAFGFISFNLVKEGSTGSSS